MREITRRTLHPSRACHDNHSLTGTDVLPFRRYGQKADIASGPGFENAVGFDTLDSIFGNDFPSLAEDGEFNKFTEGATMRMDAILRGKTVRGRNDPCTGSAALGAECCRVDAGRTLAQS